MISRLLPGAWDALFPFQTAAIGYLQRFDRHHLWAKTGCGKTRIGIFWALDERNPAAGTSQECPVNASGCPETRLPAGARLPIVVVTKSAVRWQWRDEIQAVTSCSCQILEGETGSAAAVQANVDFYVVGYDTLLAWEAALRQRLRGGYTLVLDEIHKVKSHKRWDAQVDPNDPMGRPRFSPKANRAAAVMRLAYAARRCLGMTATPIPDRLRDLWAQLDLVHPRIWGTFWDFVKRYCDAREGEFGMVTNGIGSEVVIAELEQRLAKVAYEIDSSVIDAQLPAKTRSICRIPESEQVRALGSMAKEIKAAAKLGRTHLAEMKLMEAASRKRKALLTRVEDDVDHSLKVLVFTGRRMDARHLADSIKKFCPQVWCLTGEDGGEDRNVAVKQYMAADGPAVLVGTIGALGEGLNLQRTNKAYVAMLPWRPADIIQLEGRVCRLGGWPCEIIFLIAEGTYDTRVVEVIVSKLPIVERVVDSGHLDLLTQELKGGTDDEILQRMFGKLLGAEPWT